MKKLFDEIPCLEEERIILKKITENDREALQEMGYRKNIYRYEPSYLLEQQFSSHKSRLAQGIHLIEFGPITYMSAIQIRQIGITLVQHNKVKSSTLHTYSTNLYNRAALLPPNPDSSLMNSLPLHSLVSLLTRTG